MTSDTTTTTSTTTTITNIITITNTIIIIITAYGMGELGGSGGHVLGDEGDGQLPARAGHEGLELHRTLVVVGRHDPCVIIIVIITIIIIIIIIIIIRSSSACGA
jgi:hypothetical protein